MVSHREKRGVKTKLLGVVMVSLGILDSLLTLRGGMPDEKYILLIVLGIGVYIVGAVRAAGQQAEGAKEGSG